MAPDCQSLLLALAGSLIAISVAYLLLQLSQWRNSRGRKNVMPYSASLWAPNARRGFLRTRGFLSYNYDPLRDGRLRDAEALLSRLTSLASGPHEALNQAILALPVLDMPSLLTACATDDEAETLAERVFFVYSFLSYAYLRPKEQNAEASNSAAPLCLPRVLAAPWHAAATYVDRTPQLDYVTTVLLNIEPDDDGTAQVVTYTATSDERNFYHLHARIELAAAPAVGALLRALDGPRCGYGPLVLGRAASHIEDSGSMLTEALRDIASGLRGMSELMPRMVEGTSPKVFHEAIRTPLSSFGRPVIFEGVSGAGGSTLTLELGGASGAQSAILPAVDAFLGIGHSGPHELEQWSPSTTPFLRHLPPAHRELIRQLRSSAPGSASTVQTIAARLADEGGHRATSIAQALLAAHAACLDALTGFRKAHMALVRQFIVSPALHERAEALKAALTPRDPYPVSASSTGPGAGTGTCPAADTVSSSPLTNKARELPPPSATISPVRPPTNRSTGTVGSGSGNTSPVDVRYTFVGTGGSDLMSFLSGRLLDTARAGVRRR